MSGKSYRNNPAAGLCEPVHQSMAPGIPAQSLGNAVVADAVGQSSAGAGLYNGGKPVSPAATQALSVMSTVRGASPSLLELHEQSLGGTRGSTATERNQSNALSRGIGTAMSLGQSLLGPEDLAESGSGHVGHALTDTALKTAVSVGSQRLPAEVMTLALNGQTAAAERAAHTGAAMKVGLGGLGNALAAADAVLPENALTGAIAQCTPEAIIGGGMEAAGDLAVLTGNALTGDTRAVERQSDRIHDRSFDQGYTPIDQTLTWAADAVVDPSGTASRIIDPENKNVVVRSSIEGGCEWANILNPGLGDCSPPVYGEQIGRAPTFQELADYCHDEKDWEWCRDMVTRVDSLPHQLRGEEPDYGPLAGRLGPNRHNFGPEDVP